MKETWRLLEGSPCPAASNMALDEAVSFSVRRASAPPTLRIYRWSAPSVTVGCFQRIADIDTGYCAEKHIPVVRRVTGGRAIFHWDDLTYSFSARTLTGTFSRGLLDSYRKINLALSLALTRVGLSPESKLTRAERGRISGSSRNSFCFRAISFGEIAIGGRKIVGSAQKRWKDGLLQQGSIPLVINSDKVHRICRRNSVQEIEESAVGLRELSPSVGYATLKDAVTISFEETFGIEFAPEPPLDEETSLARELEREKYLSPEWTNRR